MTRTVVSLLNLENTLSVFRPRFRGMLNVIVCLAIGPCVQGCFIYPVYKTIQQKQAFLVLDDKGMPVEGAIVTYTSHSNPHNVREGSVSQQTNKDGRVLFPEVREWQTEATVIHGWKEYSWSWCVTASGYETAMPSWADRAKSAEISVRLKPGETTACPSEGIWKKSQANALLITPAP